MIKNILLLALFFTTYVASASMPIKNRCDTHAKQIIQKWNSLDQWTKRGPNLFLSPTLQFGRWIILKVDDAQNLMVTKATKNNQIRVSFSGSNCKRKLEVFQAPNNQARKLGDQKLRKQIANKRGIIYLWSPHMPLSIKGIKEIEAATKELGLTLIVFMDERSRTPFHFPVSSKYKRKISSFELKMRNAYLHFPVLLSFEDEQIKNTIKYGYENKSDYKKYIKSIFSL